MNNKRYYLSGPITGREDDYLDRFERAELKLKAKGYDVINPAAMTLELAGKFTHAEYMAVAMAGLALADGIYMMDGWQNSKGCKIEYDYAVKNNLFIIQENE